MLRRETGDEAHILEHLEVGRLLCEYDRRIRREGIALVCQLDISCLVLKLHVAGGRIA